MPTISEFFGILIKMYYNDHNPPHFHASYGEFEAIVAIESLEITDGHLPKRAKAMVLEWASENREALIEDWALAKAHQPLNKIEPLE